MKTLLIIHAGAADGTTRRLVEAALKAARGAAPTLEFRVRAALEAEPVDMLQASAVVFATPEKFGYMAGALKDFFDRSFYPLEGKVTGLGYALIVSAGSDGRGAVEAVERIVRGFPLKPLAPPLRVVGAPSEEDLAHARELGAALAVGIEMGIF